MRIICSGGDGGIQLVGTKAPAVNGSQGVGFRNMREEEGAKILGGTANGRQLGENRMEAAHGRQLGHNRVEAAHRRQLGNKRVEAAHRRQLMQKNEIHAFPLSFNIGASVRRKGGIMKGGFM